MAALGIRRNRKDVAAGLLDASASLDVVGNNGSDGTLTVLLANP